MNISSVDTTVLNKIRELFEEDFDQQYALFLTNIECYLCDLEKAVRETRYSDAAGIAHKIVSSAGLYGATRLSLLANEFQYTAPNKDTPLSRMLEDMRKEFTFYTEYVDALSSTDNKNQASTGR